MNEAFSVSLVFEVTTIPTPKGGNATFSQYKIFVNIIHYNSQLKWKPPHVSTGMQDTLKFG
jgi:hypothetical protein